MSDPITPLDPLAPTEQSVVAEGEGATIGRYKLLQVIGEGGFGVVYMAEQTEPVTRRVALKIIKLGMDTRQVIARFEAERQALALMDHPNIAKVLDAGATDTGRPFFVMELVKGIPITKYCDDHKLSTEERLRLFLDVCNAIQHAHQKGIIHRDIKPSNILVTVNERAPVPKVIDFGIAKATQTKLTDKTLFTRFEQIIGTPAYMSPEQAEMSGLDIDTRSDIYSLGVLLYELLTGQTPFDSKQLLSAGLDEMRRIIREQEPVRPSTRISQTLSASSTNSPSARSSRHRLLEVRGDLDWIILKAIEKDRTRRYETANGLAADLKRHLASEPVLARPPSTGYRLKSAFRRHRLAFAAAAAIAASLVAGLCASTWLFIKEARARAEQAKLREVAQAALAQEEKQRRAADQSAQNLRQVLYASEMSAAYTAYWAGSIQRTRDLLDGQRLPAVASNRGFEWRWLWGQSRPAEQFVINLDNAQTSSVDVHPDRQRLLTLGGGLRIWNASTRQVITNLNQGWGYHAEFSPDGRFVVATEHSILPVRVYSATNYSLVTNLSGHTLPIARATFSPDGRYFATVGSYGYSKIDGEIFLWDTLTWNRLAVLISKGSQWLFPVRFSPDSKTLAAGYGSGEILFWDIHSRTVARRFTGHNANLTDVAFTSDGKRLVSTGLDRTIRLWDILDGRQINMLGQHEKPVWSLALSPDDRWLVTTGFDHMVKLWDLNEQRLFHTFRGHLGRATSAAFHPDGRTLLTTALDGTLRYWPIPEKPEEWLVELQGLTFGFSSTNRLLLGLEIDPYIEVWDVASRTRLLQILGDNPCWIPGTERFVFWRDGQLGEYDVHSKSEQLFGSTGETKPQGGALSCSPDGRMLLWPHDNHTHLFDRLSRTALSQLDTGANGTGHALFSPNNSTIATAGSGSSEIQLWAAATGHRTKVLAGQRQGINSLNFSPDGRRLASTSVDRSTCIFALDTGEQWILRDDEGEPRTVVFAPDGKTLAVGTFDGSVKLWNVATRHQIASFNAGASVVFSVAFAPDGSALAATTFDGKVRVWTAPPWSAIDSTLAASQ